MQRLERLVELLTVENEIQNLIAAASIATIWQRHIADSAQLLKFVSHETATWLDLGSGAGFPGLVIAALQPKREVVLVESRAKRIDWLQRAAAVLELPCLTVVGKRLEQMETREADVISARAFAPMPRLIQLAERFSHQQTIWLLPKGRSARLELAGIANYPHLFHVEQSATDAESGIIVGTLSGKKDKRT